jgi:hypothetical protein
MKNTLTFVFLFFLFSAQMCEKQDVQAESVEAQLINNIAVDGCSWRLVVGNDVYAPSTASQKLIDAAAAKITSNGTYDLAVKVKYSLTKNKKVIVCGWGVRKEIDEAEITEIVILY